MRNVFIIALALVFSTGVAFAQDNEAFVDQVSVAGADHDALVDQTGSENEARVTQSSVNPPLFGGHEAIAFQDGSGNFARQIQEGGSNNFARIDQDGHNNSARQEQGRNGNEARIVQSGDDNEALQFQDMQTTVDASNNFARINQHGADNYARQDQDVARNDARISQDGSGNWARQSQDGVSTGIGHNTARTFQNGHDHRALIVQSGGSGFPGPGHFARIDQDGVGNNATIRQRD
jgi:hypothetical protein